MGSVGSLPSLCQANVPHSPEPTQHPKYSMESTSLAPHQVSTAAVGLSSSAEGSQVGFMGLFCKKCVLNRKRLAEAEAGPNPSR